MDEGNPEAKRSLPAVLGAVRDFERLFAEGIQQRKNVQIKLLVTVKDGCVKAVRLHEEREYELDAHV